MPAAFRSLAIWLAICASVVAPVTAYLAVRFLMRFFETNSLMPFAVYCFLAGLGCTLYFLV